MEKLKIVAINGAVIFFFAIILVWGNAWHRQKIQFQKGEAAMARGDYIAAVAGYEASIHMYTPFSSRVQEAAQKLWMVGQRLEQSGDSARALVAYRSLRSSFYAVRGLNAPGKDWIDRCD